MSRTIIMAIVAIILGFYIIYQFFQKKDGSSGKSSQIFEHICYQMDNQLTHSVQLQEELVKNEFEIQNEKNYTGLGYDFIEKKQVQVVKVFDKFVGEFYNMELQTKSSVQVFDALKKAESSYKECYNNLKHIFEEKQCKQDWNAYLNGCVTKLQQIKKILNKKMDEWVLVLKKIENETNGNSPKNEINPIDRQLKEYKLEDQLLKEKLMKIEEEIKVQMKKIQQIDVKLRDILLQINQMKKLISECEINQNYSLNCQKIIKEMLKFGYESIEGFADKIEKKKLSLGQMRDILNRNDGIYVTQELKIMYHKSLDELRQLLKIFAHYKIEMNKHCGCSKEKLEEHKRTLTIKQSEYKNNEKDKNKRDDEIKSKQKKIEEIKMKRVNITNKLKQLMNRTVVKKNNTVLIRYFESMKTIDAEIEEKQKQYKDELRRCNQLKQKLSRYILQFSSLSDCLVKKQYYLELKKKYGEQLPDQIKMSNRWADELKRIIEDFKIR